MFNEVFSRMTSNKRKSDVGEPEVIDLTISSQETAQPPPGAKSKDTVVVTGNKRSKQQPETPSRPEESPPVLLPETPTFSLLEMEGLALLSPRKNCAMSVPPVLEPQAALVNQPGTSQSFASTPQKPASVQHHWDGTLGVKQVFRKAHANVTNVVRR